MKNNIRYLDTFYYSRLVRILKQKNHPVHKCLMNLLQLLQIKGLRVFKEIYQSWKSNILKSNGFITQLVLVP